MLLASKQLRTDLENIKQVMVEKFDKKLKAKGKRVLLPLSVLMPRVIPRGKHLGA
jgi:hypothetical protein